MLRLWDRSGQASEPVEGNNWRTPLATEENTAATRTSDSFLNVGGRTLTLVVVTTNKAGTTADYTPSLQATYDGTTWFTFWTAAAVIENEGTLFYTFGPGCSGAGSETENIECPIYRDMRVVLTAATADGSNNMDTAAHVHLGC